MAHLLGRDAGILPREWGCPIHIIMERSTGKTMECFVEFVSIADAQAALAWVNRGMASGRAPRLGSRHIQIEMSDQGALLKAMFPRAKCLDWKNATPRVLPNTDPRFTGFQGFFTSEEIYGMVRHAEVPQRVCQNSLSPLTMRHR